MNKMNVFAFVAENRHARWLVCAYYDEKGAILTDCPFLVKSTNDEEMRPLIKKALNLEGDIKWQAIKGKG